MAGMAVPYVPSVWPSNHAARQQLSIRLNCQVSACINGFHRENFQKIGTYKPAATVPVAI
jgi:hypothetical protein